MNGMKINPDLKLQYEKAGYWGRATLFDRWNDAVSCFGDRLFVVDDRGERLTYSQLDEKADAFASYLEKSGVQQGNVVTFQITPRSEFVTALFACFKIGAVPAPLGMCFMCGELEGLMTKLGSVLHISVSEYHGADRRQDILSLRDNLPRLKKLVFVNNIEFPGDREESFAKIAASGGRPQNYSTARPDELALILCTSGTTKGSKAVMFTHDCIIYSEEVFNRAYCLTQEDSIFMPAPLNHATGLHHGIISPMLRGGGMVLQERFKCADAIDMMNREKCSYSMGATPFIYDILKQLEESGKRLDHLNFYICGGAPVPRDLVRKAFEEHNILVCECYGSTESVPHVGVRPQECLENDGLSAGRAMDGIEVRIVDKKHRPVAAGVIGEEASRGPNMFVGYLDAPDLTEEALDDEGWFYSGDLAVMDEMGRVRIVGRIKDLIVRGGENLNSNLINDNIEGCPGILDHAVIGMPDERLGERICTFVVLKEGSGHVTVESLRAYLRSKGVQKRLWPERVEIIDEIPRTESGKVRKNLLSAELARRMEGEKSHESR